MKEMKCLPEAEFEVMKVIWASKPPVSANQVREELDASKNWKVQTVVTLLLRLVERGFLRTEKVGRDRIFSPLVEREEYLRFETGQFMRQYHDSSPMNLVNALYDGKTMTEGDIEVLLAWAKERRG